MKIEGKNSRLVLSATQSGANTDKITYQDLDPFDRQAGFVLKAVEIWLDPTKLSDIAADASILVQVFGATSAVPTAKYATGDKRVISRFALSIPLTTSGVAAINCQDVWTPPDGVDVILGCEYMGIIVVTAGFTSAAIVDAVLYGDTVTLTTDEIATSRLRFT